METYAPETNEQLAETLRQNSSARRSIVLGGSFSKNRMGGPPATADVCISTRELDQLVRYEPQDLTVSVGAGMRWDALRRLLAGNRQMVPIDPPLATEATVGGVVAANCSGPRRRQYGSARDAVIGMKFALLDGRLVETGGMVVKNVAGLDMGKLMIGSFGTLAAIAQVNFKVSPVPPYSRTFLLTSAGADAAMATRDKLLRGVLQPVAADLLNPHASARFSQEGWLLAVQASGNEKVIERWQRELTGVSMLEGDAEEAFWKQVRDFTPAFLAAHHDGAVARVSVPLAKVGDLAASAPVPLLARAGNGVCYAHFSDCESATRWLASAVSQGCAGVLEWVPPRQCTAGEQWPKPGDDFETMRRIKQMFDPECLLNRGRLYGRL
jgi:glycolate oxidase FAD binding subunit